MPWDASPHQDRFDPLPNEKTMKAVVTAGNHFHLFNFGQIDTWQFSHFCLL